ncbi:MAG: pilin [Arenimonas sp.]
MRCFLLGFSGFFLAALLASIAFASYGDYTARASLAETMQSVVPLQTQIAEIIMTQNSVEHAGFALDPPIAKQSFPNTDFLKVSDDGTIVFRSRKHGQIIVLAPFLNSGSVTWRCLGSKPDKNLPVTCR